VGFDALDSLYRARAVGLKIAADPVPRQDMAFDIAHMAREELPENLPLLNRIDWSATRFGSDGHLHLYRANCFVRKPP